MLYLSYPTHWLKRSLGLLLIVGGCTSLSAQGNELELSPSATPFIEESQNELESKTNTRDEIEETASSLPLAQRVTLLERQIRNLTQMNLPAQIERLEQQIQVLTGQLEEQTHRMDLYANKQVPEKTASPLSASSEPILPSTPPERTRPSFEKVPNKIADAEAALVKNESVPSHQKTESLSSPARPSEKSENGNAAYQSAFDRMSQKKTPAAIEAFQTFLHNYPESSYAPNAHYWLAELYGQTHKTPQAIQELNILIKQYPSNAKVPYAMLSLALLHETNGEKALARQQLQQILKQYPDSDVAKFAQKKLQGISGETIQ